MKFFPLRGCLSDFTDEAEWERPAGGDLDSLQVEAIYIPIPSEIGLKEISA